jgi:hypothetical protein
MWGDHVSWEIGISFFFFLFFFADCALESLWKVALAKQYISDNGNSFILSVSFKGFKTLHSIKWYEELELGNKLIIISSSCIFNIQ